MAFVLPHETLRSARQYDAFRRTIPRRMDSSIRIFIPRWMARAARSFPREPEADAVREKSGGVPFSPGRLRRGFGISPKRFFARRRAKIDTPPPPIVRPGHELRPIYSRFRRTRERVLHAYLTMVRPQRAARFGASAGAPIVVRQASGSRELVARSAQTAGIKLNSY
jgi:hypothetical protein